MGAQRLYILTTFLYAYKSWTLYKLFKTEDLYNDLGPVSQKAKQELRFKFFLKWDVYSKS